MHTVTIRLGATGRTIHLPGHPAIHADSPVGKSVIRMIRDGIELRRGGAR